jgi:hypothetical protein
MATATLAPKRSTARRSTATREPSRNNTTTLHPDEFPAVYALQCVGTCLEPEIMDGTTLVFHRDEPYRPGDLVVLFKRPEMVKPGNLQMIVKRLILAPSHAYWRNGDRDMGDIKPVVIVEMLNPRRTLYADPDSLLGIHKCRGPAMPGEVKGPRLSDEDVRRFYNQREARR